MNHRGINAVAHETGIHPSSLRRWESLGLFSPERIQLGATCVRLYPPQTVDLLKRVKELMDEGYRLNAAFEKAKKEIPAQEDSNCRDEDRGTEANPYRLV
jgi:DNA-binding transcriptional MerR regulator